MCTAKLSNRSRRRIEVAGPVGSGKSTVARALADHLSLYLVEESYQEVPFWRAFYERPQDYAFQKNVSFLLFHTNWIFEAIKAGGAVPLICDFSVFQDLAYTRLSGSKLDYQAAVAVYRRLLNRIGKPDIVIRIRCSLPEQLRRIQGRGRGPEQSITGSYLEQLSSSIDIEQLRHLGDVPVVEVDTEALDFKSRPADAVASIHPHLQAIFQ